MNIEYLKFIRKHSPKENAAALLKNATFSNYSKDKEQMHYNRFGLNINHTADQKITLQDFTKCSYANSCNANICPLDPGYLNRSHLKSEPVCRYFRQCAKGGNGANSEGVMLVIRGLPLPSHYFRAETRYSTLRADLKRIKRRYSQEVTA